MIPKIIHFCWFSGESYPPVIRRCLHSWRHFLPDFKIKIWTRQMALDTGIPFVVEAINAQKWAFAADAVRLYAIYYEGGIYMDGDILIKGRFDAFLCHEAVFFQECYSSIDVSSRVDDQGRNLCYPAPVRGFCLQAALFMARPEHPFVRHLLDYYYHHPFLMSEGVYATDPIAPDIYALEAEAFGYRYLDTPQELQLGARVFPSCYVASSPNETDSRNFAIHCTCHSWAPDAQPSVLFTVRQYVYNWLHGIF